MSPRHPTDTIERIGEESTRHVEAFVKANFGYDTLFWWAKGREGWRLSTLHSLFLRNKTSQVSFTLFPNGVAPARRHTWNRRDFIIWLDKTTPVWRTEADWWLHPSSNIFPPPGKHY